MKELIKNIFESDVVNKALDIYIPQFLLTNDEELSLKASIGIVSAFGMLENFMDILKDSKYEYIAVENFARNAKLLIDKTWVEEGNEFFKFQTVKKLEKLSTHLCSALKNSEKSYLVCFDDFCSLLEELVCLLFGKEVGAECCIEYILRMEPSFGFFCYYVIQMPNLKDRTEKHARLAILVAIVFLSEF